MKKLFIYFFMLITTNLFAYDNSRLNAMEISAAPPPLEAYCTMTNVVFGSYEYYNGQIVRNVTVSGTYEAASSYSTWSVFMEYYSYSNGSLLTYMGLTYQGTGKCTITVHDKCPVGTTYKCQISGRVQHPVTHNFAFIESDMKEISVPTPPALNNPVIIGPSSANYGANCSYAISNVNELGGSAPLSVKWYRQVDGGASQQVGIGSTYSQTITQTFSVYCVVTDALNREKVSNTITTNVIIPDLTGVAITGPSSLASGQTGNFVATVFGGVPTYHFNWQIFVNSSSLESLPTKKGKGHDIVIESVPVGQWVSVGPDNWNADLSGTSNFQVRCIVTDAVHEEPVTSGVLNVTVTGARNLQLAKSDLEMQDDENLPTNSKLEQNHPNPFNPSTLIKYSLSEPSFVSLKVYNALGQEVANLVNEYKSAGNFNATFNAGSLTSGIYIYKLQSNNFTEIKKMILTK